MARGYDFWGDSSPSDEERAQILRIAKTNWLLLLQLDSNQDFMWGDVGRLYFMTPRADLEAADFTNVKCVLQCF